jgi:hypothetical protein
MLRIPTINSDGSQNDDATITVVLRDPESGAPLAASVDVRPISSREYQAEQKKHRTWVKNHARQMEAEYDHVATVDALLPGKIVSWTGIHGADGNPLPVMPATVQALWPWMKMQILKAATGGAELDGEAADASFREPA